MFCLSQSSRKENKEIRHGQVNNKKACSFQFTVMDPENKHGEGVRNTNDDRQRSEKD